MKAKKKLATHISNKDKARAVLADAERMRSHYAHEAAAWRLKYSQAVAELDALKLAHAHKEAVEKLATHEQQQASEKKDAQDKYQALVAELGKRYSFDWRSTGIDPETGSLLPIDSQENTA